MTTPTPEALQRQREGEPTPEEIQRQRKDGPRVGFGGQRRLPPEIWTNTLVLVCCPLPPTTIEDDADPKNDPEIAHTVEKTRDGCRLTCKLFHDIVLAAENREEHFFFLYWQEGYKQLPCALRYDRMKACNLKSFVLKEGFLSRELFGHISRIWDETSSLETIHFRTVNSIYHNPTLREELRRSANALFDRNKNSITRLCWHNTDVDIISVAANMPALQELRFAQGKDAADFPSEILWTFLSFLSIAFYDRKPSQKFMERFAQGHFPAIKTFKFSSFYPEYHVDALLSKMPHLTHLTLSISDLMPDQRIPSLEDLEYYAFPQDRVLQFCGSTQPNLKSVALLGLDTEPGLFEDYRKEFNYASDFLLHVSDTNFAPKLSKITLHTVTASSLLRHRAHPGFFADVIRLVQKAEANGVSLFAQDGFPFPLTNTSEETFHSDAVDWVIRIQMGKLSL